MSDYSYQSLPLVDGERLGQYLCEGAEGGWDIDDLGAVQVQGDGRTGRLLLTHGAGAGQDSAFLVTLRRELADAGVQTLAIEFDYLRRMREEGRRRPPPRVDRLVDELARWCDSVSHRLSTPLWLGGKSMGGRVASLLAARESVAGLVLCGYPFHPPRKPESLRLDHWPSLACPTLVVQGSRDPFGTRAEVDGYTLPPCAEVHWLEDGDHDWKPRRSSGRDQADLLREGAQCIAAFMTRHQ
ncbi:alpha/beta family hydrolase [Halomonas nitroreducens]|uniref:Dienelactone hydrolase n=1 Tax=Halomonas nitroreducens TaxID=447425 RepID=A0A431V2W6_9GAMM|nr:alpha/beta family hydrolase [Halomonas nitroreducens]RTR03783.1 dienelactone hydrolase [Halomonas nitroreducens]